MEDERTVTLGNRAFRLHVGRRSGQLGLTFESVDVDAGRSLGEVTLPYPSAGYGGAELSISPDGKSAGAVLYSGQSETGYELFELEPTLRHVGGLPYVYGEWDLSPMAFSPDGALGALAIVPDSLWWVDPDDEDPDWETPAIGGVTQWAVLYVHRLTETSPTTYAISVDVPKGWVGGEEPWPRNLRFSSARELTLGLPWSGDFRFELPDRGERIMVPSPAGD